MFPRDTMPRHIVLKDKYGDAIEEIAKRKKQKLGTATEVLLDSNTEIQEEFSRKGKK